MNPTAKNILIYGGLGVLAIWFFARAKASQAATHPDASGSGSVGEFLDNLGNGDLTGLFGP